MNAPTIREQVAHDPERAAFVGMAALALSAAINSRPGTDGTTAARELAALLDGDAPGAYQDDLRDRVGVNVTAARAFLRFASINVNEG